MEGTQRMSLESVLSSLVQLQPSDLLEELGRTANGQASNATGNATYHGGDHQDDASAVAASLILVGCLVVVLGGLALSVQRRPKLTLAVLVTYFAWFGAQVANGKADEVEAMLLARFKVAIAATVEEVQTTWKMLVAWGLLFLPFLKDLWNWISPLLVWAWHSVVQLWSDLTWNQRGQLGLGLLGVAGAASAIWQIFRWIRQVGNALPKEQRREELYGKVKDVLGQLSFVIVGPIAYWLVANLLSIAYANYTVMCAMDFLPVVLSLWSLMQLKTLTDVAETKARQEQQGSTWTGAVWAITQNPHSRKRRRLPEEAHLENDITDWLSYWACWPAFRLALWLNMYKDWVPEEYKAHVDGVLLAVVIGARYWHFSRVIPSAFGVCGNISENLVAALRRHRPDVGANALQNHGGRALSLFSWMQENFGAVAACGCAILVILYIAQKALLLASQVMMVCLLLFAAGDSASKVSARLAHPPTVEDPGNIDEIRQRSCLWIITLVWLGLCYMTRSFPLVGGVVSMLTCPVIVLTLLAGEMVLRVFMQVIMGSLHTCCGCFLRSMQPSSNNREIAAPLLETAPADSEAALAAVAAPPGGNELAAEVAPARLAPLGEN